jgi:hypothetical protein
LTDLEQLPPGLVEEAVAEVVVPLVLQTIEAVVLVEQARVDLVQEVQVEMLDLIQQLPVEVVTETLAPHLVVAEVAEVVAAQL